MGRAVAILSRNTQARSMVMQPLRSMMAKPCGWARGVWGGERASKAMLARL